MRARRGARRAWALFLGAVLLGGCGEGEPFAGLPPREVPAGIDALADGDGWVVTDGGVRAEGGGTFELVIPDGDVPDGPGETVLNFHLDRIEPDGTTVETVDIAAVTVTQDGPPEETMVLPDDAGTHYELFAEVTRADGTFDRYQEWLYVP